MSASCTECHADLEEDEADRCQPCINHEQEILEAEMIEERQRHERHEMNQHYERYPHG